MSIEDRIASDQPDSFAFSKANKLKSSGLLQNIQKVVRPAR
jgi:hypothetical protein